MSLTHRWSHLFRDKFCSWKIRNGAIEIMRRPGKDDSRKKPEVKNPVTLYL